MAFGSHVDDLSQFASGTSLTQHLHDAIKNRQGGKFGLTLSNKSTLLANDKDRESARRRGCSHLSIVSGHGPGNRNACGQEAHWQRQETGERSQPTMQDEFEGASSARREESSPLLPGRPELGRSRNAISWLYVRWILLSAEHSKNLWYLQTARSPITVSVFVVSNAFWPPGKLQLWECSGNNLIAHEHMEHSVHLVQLAHECWVSDQILLIHGLMPRDWLPNAPTKTYWLLPTGLGGSKEPPE